MAGKTPDTTLDADTAAKLASAIAAATADCASWAFAGFVTPGTVKERRVFVAIAEEKVTVRITFDPLPDVTPATPAGGPANAAIAPVPEIKRPTPMTVTTSRPPWGIATLMVIVTVIVTEVSAALVLLREMTGAWAGRDQRSAVA